MATPRKSFKTTKGTELPLLNLKGKEYLQVAHRLVWFREDHKDGTIRTQLMEQGGDGKDAFAVFKAEIHIMVLNPQTGNSQPMLVATAHKKETAGGFADYLEKAETGSIGRALALMGYGTQFTADELDEGVRLADSPLAALSDKASVEEAVTTPLDTPIPMRRSSFRKNPTVPAGTSSGADEI
jgi:hypothetical protein